ncbi:winged helix-turn-helix transcriptional regulator [Amycolatopsis japonica]|uniref:winged helix-turn-helix transcriptional regulator n=1 Tax=Amycolatopsis japonica TaxID=208439 RepID=UPI0033D3AA2F
MVQSTISRARSPATCTWRGVTWIGRTRRPEPDCPVEVALAAISGRWTTLVLRELMGGARSFGDLTARRLAVREELPGFPSRTSYRLTPAGQELRPLLIELHRSGSALLAQ